MMCTFGSNVGLSVRNQPLCSEKSGLTGLASGGVDAGVDVAILELGEKFVDELLTTGGEYVVVDLNYLNSYG